MENGLALKSILALTSPQFIRVHLLTLQIQ